MSHGTPQRRTHRLALALAAGVVAAAVAVATPLVARAQPGTATAVANSPSAALDRARTALDKYRDPIAAVRDGYFSTLGCISYPAGGGEGTMAYKPGGMGVHFLNMQNVGPTLDPSKPQVLIYQPVADRLQLVAAEWFVPVEVAGNVRPAIFGQELQGPMVGHQPIMPEGLHHYDLHVWLWKKNPTGQFEPTNPDVTCPKSAYSFQEAAPKMAHPQR